MALPADWDGGRLMSHDFRPDEKPPTRQAILKLSCTCSLQARQCIYAYLRIHTQCTYSLRSNMPKKQLNINISMRSWLTSRLSWWIPDDIFALVMSTTKASISARLTTLLPFLAWRIDSWQLYTLMCLMRHVCTYTPICVCVYIYMSVCVWVKGTWRFHVYIHIYILYTFNISTQDILKSIQQPSQQLRIWI